MSLKDLVTVIIPVYQRQSTLHRLLNYYRDLDCTILVADSSEKIFSDWELYKDFTTYLHNPYWRLHKKIAEVTDMVKTPYVQLCADDDFILKSSIRTCSDFLNKHDGKYIAAHGLYTTFEPNGLSGISLLLKYFFQYLYSTIDRELPDSIFDRIETGLYAYQPTNYALHLKETLKEPYKICSENPNLQTINLIDNIFSHHEHITGNIKTLPILHSIRSRENISVSPSPLSQEKKYICKDLNKAMIEKDEYSLQCFEDFFEHCVQTLHTTTNLDLLSCYKFVTRNYKRFFQRREEDRSLFIEDLLTENPQYGFHLSQDCQSLNCSQGLFHDNIFFFSIPEDAQILCAKNCLTKILPLNELTLSEIENIVNLILKYPL
jgi:glycosyltransferase domain-containing protein